MKDVLEKISKNKKNIIIIGVVLLVILLVVIFVLNKGSKTDRLLDIIYNKDNPVLVEYDGLYGYVSSTGEELINTEYMYATPFYGEYALASKDTEKGKYEFIDKSGEVALKIESEEAPKYYADYGIWFIDNKIYDENLKVVFNKNGKLSYIGSGFFEFLEDNEKSSGIVDYKGKMTFSWDEDYISVSLSKSPSFMDDYAIVSNMEEIEKIVNLANGKVIYELEDAKNKYLREEKDNIFRIVNRSDNYKTDEWLYVDNNKIAYRTSETIYDMSLYDYKDNVLKIDYGINYSDLGKKEREEYYDFKKHMKVEAGIELSENAVYMKNLYGYELMKDNDKYVIVKGDSAILEAIYDEILFLPNKLFSYIEDVNKTQIVLLSSEEGIEVYDLKKEKTLEVIDASHVEMKEDSTFLMFTKYEEDGYTKGEYIIYNLLTGKSMKVNANNDVELYSNYVTVADTEFITYYNTSLEEIY